MDGDIAEATDGDVLFRDAPCQRRCTSEGTAAHSGDALKGLQPTSDMHQGRDTPEGLQPMDDRHQDRDIPKGTVTHGEYMPGQELPQRDCDLCINCTGAEENK